MIMVVCDRKPKGWYRIGKFAELAGVSYSTIYRRVRSGQLKSVRISDRCFRCAVERKNLCGACE